MRFPGTTVCAVALFATALALAGEYRHFPGVATDSDTLRFKGKVEDIYSSGNYDRAMLIYAKELAPQGDKYAQYMVGYMHLTGRGVEEDPAKALAWYRLAAERGEPKYIHARDALAESLDGEELQRSTALFADLWQRYSDKRLILDLIQKDLAIIRLRDGVPVSERGILIVSDYSDSVESDLYLRRIRAQLAERLAYLDSMAEEPAFVQDASEVRVLEASVRREIEALDLP